MKEHAEKQIKSEEVKGEASECLTEARKKRLIKRHGPRVLGREQTPKLQAQPTKTYFALNIPVKSVKQPEISQPQPLRLKAKLSNFIKPKLFSVQVQPPAIIMPAISIVPKVTRLADIRVGTFMLATLHELAAPSLKLKLKHPSDVSVRPLIRLKLIKDMGISMPIIKPAIKLKHPSDVSVRPLIRLKLIKDMGISMPIIKPAIKPEIEVGEISVGRGGETQPELEAENVLDELLPSLKGESRELSLLRPLCLIAVGKSADGLGMVEHLVSTKYTYYGEYGFFMGLPWQKELMLSKIAEGRIKKKGVRHVSHSEIKESKNEKPYSLITSERLIVRIPSVNEENVLEVIRGLKEISKRGPKCIILYTQDVRPLEDLDKKVLDIDVIVIALPEYNEKLSRLIEKLLGIDLPPPAFEESIDDLWGSAVRLYEDKMKQLDGELPTKEVGFFPERESLLHYLMKRIVYWHLKKSDYISVRAEPLKPLIDEANQFIGYVVPDIIADDEYWEVETGYPTEEEKELIMEPWNPRARLTWKLSKYKGTPSKIRVVFPAIYAHLFQHDIIRVKKYFQEREIDIKFYTIYLRQRGKLEEFA